VSYKLVLCFVLHYHFVSSYIHLKYKVFFVVVVVVVVVVFIVN